MAGWQGVATQQCHGELALVLKRGDRIGAPEIAGGTRETLALECAETFI